MDFYDVIEKRRTFRDLQDTSIPEEILHRILNAGLKAPTNDHMRSWEFVVITDPDEKARILNLIPKNRSKENAESIVADSDMTDLSQKEMYMDAIPKQYSMLYHSGCLILPFFRQDHPLLKPENLSSLNGFASIWLCIENIFLATAAEGLGAAFRIPHDKEILYLKDAVGHPDNYIMPCYIAIGYPKEDAAVLKQHEFSAADKLHWNRW